MGAILYSNVDTDLIKYSKSDKDNIPENYAKLI